MVICSNLLNKLQVQVQSKSDFQSIESYLKNYVYIIWKTSIIEARIIFCLKHILSLYSNNLYLNLILVLLKKLSIYSYSLTLYSEYSKRCYNIIYMNSILKVFAMVRVRQCLVLTNAKISCTYVIRLILSSKIFI